MHALAQLAHYNANLKLSDVPQEVQQATLAHILDSVAASIGATYNPLVTSVRNEYLALTGDNGQVDVWCSEKKAPVLTSIFLNALAGHVLELDDVHTSSKTHIGTVVVPAAWSMAQHLNATGEDLLLAVICGYETMARIGMGLGVSSHRNKGWHVTATAGTFGAAAACAKLLGLDQEKTLTAFGMAGTQSFGTWAFLTDSATCKALHPGRAAQSGAEAALLAQAGMTGPEHILEAADGGIFPAMSDNYDYDFVCKDLGVDYQLMYVDNKPYPCCRSTHGSIDCGLDLRKKIPNLEDIQSIHVDTYLVGYKQCAVSQGSLHPVTAVDAKFSTPYTLACALVCGEVSLKHFTPLAIADPKVQAVMEKITVTPADRFTDVYPDHWGCEVVVTCKDGSSYTCYAKDASGSVDNPLSWEQLKAKAKGLLEANPLCNVDTVLEQISNLSNETTIPILN